MKKISLFASFLLMAFTVTAQANVFCPVSATCLNYKACIINGDYSKWKRYAMKGTHPGDGPVLLRFVKATGGYPGYVDTTCYYKNDEFHLYLKIVAKYDMLPAKRLGKWYRGNGVYLCKVKNSDPSDCPLKLVYEPERSWFHRNEI